ncbi:MAG: PLP-dependent aspartate aminotransferase family protein [Candidatus Omnitrophota bacterium]
MDLHTKTVFKGVNKDPNYNSVITPIYPSATFRFDSVDKKPKYDYTRTGNPTREALEENVASLEGGLGALATASGMAAITGVLFLCYPGDHIICGNDLYGGTYRLFRDVFAKMGFSFSFIDMTKTENIKKEIRKKTKMIWIETPSNPLLHITDLQAAISLAKEHKILTVVDNTFLSPYFQRPLEFEADIVVHSTTKYLNGHSDVVGGIIVYNSEDLKSKLHFIVNSLGLSQSPYDAWLVLRGVKTLGPRMEMHQKNGLHLANFLKEHPCVKKIYYCGLQGHPQFELIKKQMKGFGGMLSFDLDTSKVPLEKFFSKLTLFSLAESLGGVESLIEAPWFMSHSSMGEEALKTSGITKETIRISAGIESAKDLMGELKNALEP